MARDARTTIRRQMIEQIAFGYVTFERQALIDIARLGWEDTTPQACDRAYVFGDAARIMRHGEWARLVTRREREIGACDEGLQRANEVAALAAANRIVTDGFVAAVQQALPRMRRMLAEHAERHPEGRVAM